MKFKMMYVYLIFFAVAVTLLIMFIQNSGGNDGKKVVGPGDIVNKQMPADELHKGLNNPTTPAPTKDNVSEGFKHELNALEKELKKNPGDTSAMRQYADLLANSHKQDEAIILYEKILKKNPQRTDILFSLSFIYYGKGNFFKAEEMTKKILFYDKKNTQALYNIGAIAASKGDSQKAREVWTKLIADFPNSESTGLAKESLSKLK
jgi:tetratricopeptide (TPR) repeat protein